MSKSPDQSHLFCLGMGYSARHVARLASFSGWQVSGTTRREPADPAGEEWPLYQFNGAEGHWLAQGFGAGVTHLLVSIPARPDAFLLENPPAERSKEIRQFLAQTFPDLEHISYFSTTGVYGNHDGAWVDEMSECKPLRERSRERVTEEQAWSDACDSVGVPIDILRLAGIYGPGRNPLVSFRAGKFANILKGSHHFGRIHVEDIARVVMHLATRPASGTRVLNICDDLPATRQEVIAYVADLLGVAVPPVINFEDAELSPMARSFWQDSRRVNNAKLKELLPDGLLYPSYKEGLTALFEAGE